MLYRGVFLNYWLQWDTKVDKSSVAGELLHISATLHDHMTSYPFWQRFEIDRFSVSEIVATGAGNNGECKDAHMKVMNVVISATSQRCFVFTPTLMSMILGKRHRGFEYPMRMEWDFRSTLNKWTARVLSPLSDRWFRTTLSRFKSRSPKSPSWFRVIPIILSWSPGGMISQGPNDASISTIWWI